jgi:hypothetical protein
MSYLRNLCLPTHSGVHYILCYGLVCFSSSCVPYVASFSGMSFLIASSVFSNVYVYAYVAI